MPFLRSISEASYLAWKIPSKLIFSFIKLLLEKGRVKVKVKAKNILSELFTGNEEVALLVGDVKIVLMLPLTNLTNSWQTVGTQNSKLQIQTQRSH